MNAPNTDMWRAPAMAGQLYPSDADALRRFVADSVDRVRSLPSAPLAVISPQAGYDLSGRLMARALGASGAWARKTVVILAPAQRHKFDGIALPSQSRFSIPGGEIGVDSTSRKILLEDGLVHISSAAHEAEHGIEVQLPFMRHLWPWARLVPLVVGRASIEEVARVVDRLAGLRGQPPLFVISSNLSHNQPLKTARSHDAETARLIETSRGAQVTSAHTRGTALISGFMASDLAQGARWLRLGMASSFAVTGDSERTFGFGAWAAVAPNAAVMGEEERGVMLHVARRAILSRLEKGDNPRVKPGSFANPLRTMMASFVTLTQNDRLRACMGSLAPHRAVIDDVAMNAIKAAFEDERFSALDPADMDHIRIKVALLSPKTALHAPTQEHLEAQLAPGRDGLILTDGDKRATFLPMVWEQIDTGQAFVEKLKTKAGLPQDYWSPTLRFHRFFTETFSEPKWQH